MVTTIQVSDETKKQLDAIKMRKHKTYDEIVKSMLKHEHKQILREQVAEYYAVYAKEDAKEVNEWIHTETDVE